MAIITSLISEQDQKSSQRGDMDARKVDNPTQNKISMHDINKIWDKGNEIKSKYNLKDTGLSTLVKICVNWSVGKSSTAYGLAVKPNKEDITMVCTRLVRLRDKGLIEVCGTGYNQCNTWGPTKLGESVVKWLIEA